MPSPLVFLKDKKQAGVVTEHRSESEAPENHGLMVCARELMAAIEKKDYKGVAMALENAFMLLESGPHEEASPVVDETQG